jgi:hypothetical protein
MVNFLLKSSEIIVEKVFTNICQLRDVACANLLRKFETLFKYLKDMIIKLSQYYEETLKFLQDKGIEKPDVPYSKPKTESTDSGKNQNEKKPLEPKDRLEKEPFRPETQREEKSKLAKDKDDSNKGSGMDVEDLRHKLEEFVYQANIKSRGHFFVKVDNPFSKLKRNKGNNPSIDS